MHKKPIVTPRGMVSYILFRNIGQEYSNTELRAEIYKRFQKKLERRTVTRALEEIEYTTGLLDEGTRAGKFNKTIPIYSITL